MLESQGTPSEPLGCHLCWIPEEVGSNRSSGKPQQQARCTCQYNGEQAGKEQNYLSAMFVILRTVTRRGLSLDGLDKLGGSLPTSNDPIKISPPHTPTFPLRMTQ